MPEGGTLRLSVRREGGEVLFEVADSGAGIPAELLPRVFEPYLTTKAGGTGLGLAIAERIVQEHGGRLEASSPPGQGARFTMRVPVAGSAAPSPAGSG
jgi:signal transduction histidine kinase